MLLLLVVLPLHDPLARLLGLGIQLFLSSVRVEGVLDGNVETGLDGVPGLDPLQPGLDVAETLEPGNTGPRGETNPWENYVEIRSRSAVVGVGDARARSGLRLMSTTLYLPLPFPTR